MNDAELAFEREVAAAEAAATQAAEAALRAEHEALEKRKRRSRRRVVVDRGLLILLVAMTTATLIWGVGNTRNRLSKEAERDRIQAERQAELVTEFRVLLNEFRRNERQSERDREAFIDALRLILRAAGVEEDPFRPGREADQTSGTGVLFGDRAVADANGPDGSGAGPPSPGPADGGRQPPTSPRDPPGPGPPDPPDPPGPTEPPEPPEPPLVDLPDVDGDGPLPDPNDVLPPLPQIPE